MTAALGFARRRLEEVCERRERERPAAERGGAGRQINEETAPVAGRNLSLSLTSGIPPLRGMRELDQRGASIEVADLDRGPPPERRQLERETASHRFAASRAVSDRQSRNIERQVETDDRGAKIIGPSEQHIVNEHRHRPQCKSALCGDAAKQTQFYLADDGRIVEESAFIQFIAVAKLICADAQPLRGVNGRFGVENQRPFGSRRKLTLTLLLRPLVVRRQRLRGKCANRNRQAIRLLEG